MRYMMAAFPLVGAVIAFFEGCWLLLAGYLLHILQKPFSLHFFALGFTLIPIFVTGGIHLDGFMDTCDAIASHAEREKKLEILKDSHCGAFAILGCAIYFLSYFVFALELLRELEGWQGGHFGQELFRLAPALGIFIISRLLSALAVATFPIAKNSGLVHTFASASAKRFTALWCAFWLIFLSGILIFCSGTNGAFLTAGQLALFTAYYFVAKSNFGGITGDTAGAFVQTCELLSLELFVILIKLF